MIGREPLTTEQKEWNHRWGAPKGRTGFRGLRRWFPRLAGPFAFQPTSTTRRFEYPWAFAQCAPFTGARIIDIGGRFSGLPFALSSEGADATIVDPFVDYGPTNNDHGYQPTKVIDAMNRAFDTDVDVIPATLDDAGLPADSVDTVLCISVIEHLDPGVRRDLMRSIHDVLTPGGRAVFTVDLFLNVQPFEPPTTNEYGTNADIAELIASSPLDLVEGDRSELYGFPEFSAQRILAERNRYIEGKKYPVLPQAFVLAKT